MTILEKLNLTDKTPAAMLASPENWVRAKMLDAIETQIAAAEADAAGEPFTKLTSRYTTNEETGEQVKKEVPMPVRRWWGKDVSGNVVLNVQLWQSSC